MLLKEIFLPFEQMEHFAKLEGIQKEKRFIELLQKKVIQMRTSQDERTSETYRRSILDSLHKRLRVSDVQSQGELLPPGSVLLSERGFGRINRLIQAGVASSGLTNLPVPLHDIKETVKNIMELADVNGIQKFAMPVLAGDIFFRRIPEYENKHEGRSKIELATMIMEEVDKYNRNNRTRINPVYVDFKRSGSEVLNAFTEAGKIRARKGIHDNIKIGDLLNYNDHGCSVIVNAANTNMKFGGGIAGKIGTRIDEDADQETSRKNKVYQKEVEQNARIIVESYFASVPRRR